MDAEGYANDDRPDDGEENDDIFHEKSLLLRICGGGVALNFLRFYLLSL
jgi:hypothetical protein